MSENKKLRKDLKHSINTARSASPPNRKMDQDEGTNFNSNRRKNNKKMINVGSSSPNDNKKKPDNVSNEYYAATGSKASHGISRKFVSDKLFLNSRKMKQSLNVNEIS